MELRNSVKTLNYVKKFLLRETDGILPSPVRVQKPVPRGHTGTSLPRVAPAEVGVPPQGAGRVCARAGRATAWHAHRTCVARGGKVVCEAQFAPPFPRALARHPQPCQKFPGRRPLACCVIRAKLSLDEHVADIFC